MVVPVDDDRLGGFAVAGNPIKFSAFADPTRAVGYRISPHDHGTPSATRVVWSANIAR